MQVRLDKRVVEPHTAEQGKNFNYLELIAEAYYKCERLREGSRR